METGPKQELINKLEGKVKMWFGMGVFWERLFWGVGVIGLAASALSAVKEVVGSNGAIFAVIATICYGFIGFSNPQKQSHKYFRSYRKLEPALIRYINSGLSEDKLYEAYEAAEAMLNDTEQFEFRPNGAVDVQQKAQGGAL